eukprot:4773903-Pyramimonas_sp.AAC.1
MQQLRQAVATGGGSVSEPVQRHSCYRAMPWTIAHVADSGSRVEWANACTEATGDPALADGLSDGPVVHHHHYKLEGQGVLLLLLLFLLVLLLL